MHSPAATRKSFKFSRLENPAFIGTDDIKNTYLPMGFVQFKMKAGLGNCGSAGNF